MIIVQFVIFRFYLFTAAYFTHENSYLSLPENTQDQLQQDYVKLYTRLSILNIFINHILEQTAEDDRN